MAAINSLSTQITSIKAPQGNSKQNAARSCRDIFLNNPDAESGDYWVDPNLGCNEDAILVHCDADSQATCLSPLNIQTIVNNTWYTAERPKRVYYSSMEAGQKFQYIEEEPTQLTFLRLLSTTATQTVTYFCKNVQGNPIFLTASEVELTHDETSKFFYEILEDGCSESSSEWGKSVYRYTTKKTTRLPIIDFAPGEVGLANQQFGLDMGRVCFS